MTAPDSAEATSDAPAPDADAARRDDDVDAALGAGTDIPSVEEPDDDESDPEEPDAQWAEAGRGATALTWIDPVEIGRQSATAALDEDTDRAVGGAALLRDAHLRPRIATAGILVPLTLVVCLVGAYAGSTLLWPLHEVAPTVQSVPTAAVAAVPADVLWPAQGSAAVGITGLGTTASTADPAAIASITKVVSSLMVLERMPLAVGEQGPEFGFTRADNLEYWDYRRLDQSALDVPVGGVLTEYQLLQGTLLGSANNYIDRLAQEIWGSNAAFADAAATWLSDRGLDDVTIVTPSGFDDRNTATPQSLIAVAEIAMQNPVFAGIVATPSVDLPGAGTVVNTNGMLADAGVVGVKTGTLGDSWNLLTAKDVTVDDTTVHLFASVLGQSDDEQRLAETRALLAQVETALDAQEPVLAKGTTVGTVSTIWGAPVDIVTDEDADVVLWNGVAAEVTPSFELGEERESGDHVGTLTSVGPLNTATTPLVLAEDVDGPSPWWRLTHPLELFGISGAQR
nr:D-alanyl-D-alanine carboxypeptidase [Microbacterium hydrocarbonoxydans]